MLVLALCIVIFITYLLICGLVAYYFIKERKIWDSLFTYDEICNLLRESILCPIHFVLWIPGIDFENNTCSEHVLNTYKSNLKIQSILHIVLRNMKNISRIHNTSSIHNLSKQLWILEGTMKEYDRMNTENAEFYYKMSGSYDILSDSGIRNNKSGDKSTDTNNPILAPLEDLVILENNIEVCETIYNILSVFIDSDYKLLNQIESGFMKALLYDLIENIRIYKVKCLMEMEN